jgi:hypothetical protein
MHLNWKKGYNNIVCSGTRVTPNEKKIPMNYCVDDWIGTGCAEI